MAVMQCFLKSAMVDGDNCYAVLKGLILALVTAYIKLQLTVGFCVFRGDWPGVANYRLVDMKGVNNGKCR